MKVIRIACLRVRMVRTMRRIRILEIKPSSSRNSVGGEIIIKSTTEGLVHRGIAIAIVVTVDPTLDVVINVIVMVLPVVVAMADGMKDNVENQQG